MMFFIEADEEVIEEMRQLRRQGLESIEILRALKASGLTDIQLAENFVQAFDFGLGEHRVIRSWASLKDDYVNRRLETVFARRRIGNKDLEIKPVAAYLGVDAKVIEEFLQHPDIAARLIPSKWYDGRGQLRSTVIIPPDLLFELEQEFPSLDGSRLAWWAW